MAEHKYERGGLRYTPRSSAGNGCFWCEYTCHARDKTFMGETAYDSEAEAVGRTQAKLFAEHHVPVHVLTRRSSGKQG